MQLSENEQKVLKLLQTNSRLSAAEISRQLDISRTTVNVILGRLEEQVIDSYSLTLKPDILDSRINCYVLLKADPKVLTVDDALIAISEIRSLKSVAGSVDMVAQLQCDNHQHLDDILLKIARLDGITDTETLVMLKDKVER